MLFVTEIHSANEFGFIKHHFNEMVEPVFIDKEYYILDHGIFGIGLFLELSRLFIW